MKLPYPRGFAATSPSAAICDHVANFSAKGKRANLEAPEPPDLSLLFGIAPARPYVRMNATRAPIVTSGSWSAGREEKKMFLSFNPPRFRTTKNGPREERMMIRLETVTVTVTVPRGKFTLSTSNRGQTVHDSRDDSRRPMAVVRADLVRILGDTQADAACAQLSSVLCGPRKPRPRSIRPLTAEEKARAAADRNARDTADAEAAKRRAERRANPPAKEETPDFASMTAEEFAQYNAERLAASA